MASGSSSPVAVTLDTARLSDRDLLDAVDVFTEWAGWVGVSPAARRLASALACGLLAQHGARREALDRLEASWRL